MALEKCRTPDTIEITQLTKAAQEYLDKHHLVWRETFQLGTKTKKPIVTDTSNLRYSLKSGLTGCGGFSLRNWTAKRLSVKHPKHKCGDAYE